MQREWDPVTDLAIPSGSSPSSLSPRVTVSLRPKLSPCVYALGPEQLVTYYFLQEAFPECSGQAEPSTLLSLMVPLALLLPTWIVTVFVFGFPTGLATPRGAKHSSISLPGFSGLHIYL